MGDKVLPAAGALRKFLFDNFYLTPTIDREADKSKRIIVELYEYFLKYPDHIQAEMFGLPAQEDTAQLVCDYLACMTDDVALETYINVFMPKRIA